jgi:hypothetical protein
MASQPRCHPLAQVQQLPLQIVHFPQVTGESFLVSHRFDGAARLHRTIVLSSGQTVQVLALDSEHGDKAAPAELSQVGNGAQAKFRQLSDRHLAYSVKP